MPFTPKDHNQAAMDWLRAYEARGNDPLSAGQDHRNFARYITHEFPVLGAPAMLGLIPAYNAYKAMGIPEMMGTPQGSQPSLHAMAEAYRGVGDGLKDKLYGLFYE